MLAIVLSLCCELVISSSDPTIVGDNVDLIEVNHYHDAKGEHVFDQMIFYDWSNQQKRYNIRAWRLIKSEAQTPRRNYRNYSYLVRWHDDGVMREIIAQNATETWTQYDPEVLGRMQLPQDQRLDLSPVVPIGPEPCPAPVLQTEPIPLP